MYGDARLPERFWAKVYPEVNTGCWLWGAGQTRDSYGSFGYLGSGRLAHRVSYEVLVGQIPRELQIDHLCRVRQCVNPEHLEPVTARTNVRRGVGPAAKNARKLKCDQGHDMSGENLRTDPDGRRWCRTCVARRSREHYKRRRQ